MISQPQEYVGAAGLLSVSRQKIIIQSSLMGQRACLCGCQLLAASFLALQQSCIPEITWRCCPLQSICC